MKKTLERKIEIPEGVEIIKEGHQITVKKNGKEISRTFNEGKIDISVKEKNIVLHAKNSTRRESKILGTIWAHLKNMLQGLEEDFVYTLEICNVHFPMNVKIEKDRVIIKSFLGETTERVSRIMPNSKIEISGNKITVSSPDIEAAGQTAANLEKATKLTGRDRRIFQDGIYIVDKCGRGL